MKKLFTIFLVIALMLSVAACAKDEEQDPSNTTSATEQNATESSSVSTEPPTNQSEPTVDALEKQAYYDTYFESKDYKIAGSSFALENEFIKICQIIDDQTHGKLEFKFDGNIISVYRNNKGVCLHLNGVNETTDEGIDIWYTYKEQDGENVLLDNQMAVNGVIEIKDVIGTTYKETKNGLDYVVLEMENPDYVESIVIKQLTIKFTHKDKEYQTKIIYNYKDDKFVYGSIQNPNELPEDFYENFYYINYDTNEFISRLDENNKIKYEITEERDISHPMTLKVDFWINSNTHEVSECGINYNGVYTKITYWSADVFSETIEPPQDAKECTKKELNQIIRTGLMALASCV